MSRSNPTDNTPNPAARWFEWNGELGTVRYYDKDTKKNVDCDAGFTFMLLDELGSVRGWHDASESAIYSNEVRDTRQEVMVVKAFKASGVLVEGLYKDIKDKVGGLGGQFVANCYIAFKNGGDKLSIGSLRFKGAALGAWMEFRKANRSDLFTKAVRITGYTEGKKGRIVFRVPVLEVAPLSDQSNAEATKLDMALQEFLAGYLKRNRREQVEAAPAHHVRDEDVMPPDNYEPAGMQPISADDIPF